VDLCVALKFTASCNIVTSVSKRFKASVDMCSLLTYLSLLSDSSALTLTTVKELQSKEGACNVERQQRLGINTNRDRLQIQAVASK
jgi:hypothetical protein